MKHRAVIENAIGETRAAIYQGRRLVELHIERESHIKLPQVGDVYAGRIASLEPTLNGAFVNLGGKLSGFLSFANNQSLPRFVEGQLVEVVISRQALQDKLATLKFRKAEISADVGLVTKSSLRERLSTRFPDIAFAEASVSVIDEAVERRISLKSGGTITLDQTQALLAIDVDKGQGISALNVGLEAADLIASQLRLRALGGLIVVDFPNLRQTRQRNQLFKAVERAFEGDPAIVKVAPLSRFGCIELTRSLDYPSLDSLVNNRFGEPTDETLALRALRGLERDALSNKGAQYKLFVSKNIYEWLNSEIIDWKGALNDRIGERYNVVLSEIAGFSVQADR